MKISTSILSSKKREQSIIKLNNTSTEYIHIDVMDGLFVNNIQFPIKEIKELEKITQKKFDIHLMVNNPIEYIKELKNLNIEYITFHKEINQNIDNIITLIKSYGYKVGISIKPNTKTEELIPYLNKIDLVLIMSVEPGFGGQKFIENSIQKAKQIKNINPFIIVQMDGGINNTNIHKIKDYVDISVVGSYITNQTNYNKAINDLKN